MKNVEVKGWMVAIAVFVVMFGGIYITIGTGHWSTTRSQQPARLETGDYSPADIRGSYAFSEIEEFFNVPTDLLFQAFMIPEAMREPSFQIKNMEGLFAPVEIDGVEIEVGTDLIRVFTSLYSGLPYESTETTHLPETAVKALVDAGVLDEEQTAYWQAHTFALTVADEATQEAGAEPAEDEHEGVEIKGGTTMGELVQYGLTPEQFKEITGLDMPDNNALGLRDFASENGLDMETVKTGILAILEPESIEETPPAKEVPAEEAPPTDASPVEETEEASVDIKGRTTIGELQDYGLTAEQFKDLTGVDMPDDTALKLKDFVDANGLDMETVRTAIVDALAQ